MKLKNYTALTTGALYLSEFDAIMPILQSNESHKELTRELKENRFLGIKTESSRKRIISDLRRRIKFAPVDFWDFYFAGSPLQKQLSLFFLLLIAYPVAMDLQLEVVVSKWKKLEKKINFFDLEMRLNELASSVSEVGGWSERTKKNVTTNFLKSLKEANLLVNGELTKPGFQPDEFWNYFITIGESWFLEACLLSKQERDKLI